MKHGYSHREEQVLLRPLRLDDIEALRLMRNAARDCFYDDSEIDPDRQRSWFAEQQEAQRDYCFAICLPAEEGCPFVGALALYGFAEDGSAEFGRFILDAPRRGRGLGTVALRAALHIAFEELKCPSVFLSVLRSNVAARKLYESVGFAVEEYGAIAGKEVCLMRIEAGEFSR